MGFINPSYLWALFGLAIPLAIHLWSKKEGKTIKIGSIKLLSEADSRQSSSIKLNELWLLFIRMLIFSLLVLILAEPQIKQNTPNSPITYLIEPSLINNDNVIKLLDALESEVPIRLLQKEFPELTTDIIDNTNFSVSNYWQLAKDMEMLSSDSIIVITNAFSSGLKGKRPQTNKAIEWLILDPGNPVEQLLEANHQGDNVQLLSLSSSSNHLSFKKETLSINSSNLILNETKDSLKIDGNSNQNWLALQTKKPIEILLFYDDNFTNETIYIEAAFNAIAKHTTQPIVINKTQDTIDIDDSSYDCVVWLSEKPRTNESVKTLFYKPNDLAQSMIMQGASRYEFYLTKALDTENIIDEHLPEQLMLLLNLHPDIDETILQYDKRIVAKQELEPHIQNVKTDKVYPIILYISPWLWLLLAILLITERVISNIRKQ